MKKTTLAALITAVTIGAVGITSVAPAFARSGEGGPRGPRINFEEMDLNGDGLITAEEMAEHRAAQFTAQDTNGDGFLTSEELTAAVIERAQKNSEKRVERMIKHRDADGDGQLSMAELAPGEGRANKFFERLDTDGDGAISQEEMDAMKKHFGKRKQKQPASE
jgi:Ca2+-binding EF-hand superfamily protein